MQVSPGRIAWLPRGVAIRVFLLCFASTHVTLVVLALREVAAGGAGGPSAGMLKWALATTLVGMVATLVALYAVLRPLAQVEAMVDAAAADVPADITATLPADRRTARPLAASLEHTLHEHAEAAQRDPLTGALNRRGLGARVAGAVPGGVLMIDVDRFKQVNDRMGHAGGDRVLTALATALGGTLRQDDVLARYGGEEFVVFLPGARLAEAAAVAERLRREAALRVRAGAAPVSVSIGVAERAADEPLDAALARADAAVYAAKAAGRDRVQVEGTVIDGTAIDDIAIDGALRRVS